MGLATEIETAPKGRFDRLSRRLARHGKGGAAWDDSDRYGLPFFPDVALREALVAAGLLGALIVLSVVTRPTLQVAADPNAVGYVPRPEWYFLWLFQLLKYFKGSLEPVGTFLVPAGAVVLMLALPFVDRRQPRLRPLLPGTRPVRVWPRIAGAVLVAALVATTVLAAASAPVSTQAPPSSAPAEWPRRRSHRSRR
jgi:quinol-cytochrome oxidoreductase complex cytochrome b subunit